MNRFKGALGTLCWVSRSTARPLIWRRIGGHRDLDRPGFEEGKGIGRRDRSYVGGGPLMMWA